MSDKAAEIRLGIAIEQLRLVLQGKACLFREPHRLLEHIHALEAIQDEIYMRDQKANS